MIQETLKGIKMAMVGKHIEAVKNAQKGNMTIYYRNIAEYRALEATAETLQNELVEVCLSTAKY